MSWDKIRRALGYISVGSGATLIFEKILFYHQLYTIDCPLHNWLCWIFDHSTIGIILMLIGWWLVRK